MAKIEHSIELGGKKITVETGHMAKQSNGSCIVRVGDTVVLSTVVSAKKPKEGTDFLPLTVNYRERTYAAGKIPGGFFKRETRPRDGEILVSRIVDRSVRPIFAEGFNCDTQVAIVVLSADSEHETDLPSVLGTSVALLLSDAPFSEPVSCVRIGRINGKLVVNPTVSELKTCDLELLVSGTKDALNMVEAGASEVSEADMLEALKLAKEEIHKLCEFQLKFKGKEKVSVSKETHPELEVEVEAQATEKIKQIVRIAEKTSRDNTLDVLKEEIQKNLAEKYPEKVAYINAAIENIMYREARALILGSRVRTDGRKLDEIRPIECLTGVLPRTHGSALFTRGQTQALATVTLGSPDDMQVMDELAGERKERFMLHYNFPGFATGEPKPDRGTSRREIGHGALARRSLLPLLPTVEEFPYAIRVVSDILESNGSSSMASVCGGSLALFDAGVPSKASCAGVAMGLVKEGDNFAILTDIMGMEDHLGDMDFKVAGTKKGITALQMDIKIAGLSTEIMSQALDQAKTARFKILDLMESALSKPRAEISTYAPKMVSLRIPPSKIGGLIGPGGKNIRKIQEDYAVDISIEDDGRVFISGVDAVGLDAARKLVESMTAEVEVGKTYDGKVTRLMNFGAFVEILPGKEGLVHISQLSEKRVAKVEDVVKEGDSVTVRVAEIDSQGRINLTMKGLK